MMMNGFVDGSGSMMWGMGWSGVLVVALCCAGERHLTVNGLNYAPDTACDARQCV